jgi:hypothetical protein
VSRLTCRSLGRFQTCPDMLIAYGNGHFVALGSFGPSSTSDSTLPTPEFYEIGDTSPDGLNWVQHQWRSEKNVPTGIAYGNGQFVAVGSSDTAWPLAGDGIIQISTDGVNWVLRPSFGTSRLRGVALRLNSHSSHRTHRKSSLQRRARSLLIGSNPFSSLR